LWEHVAGTDHYLQNYTGGYATYNLSGGARAKDWRDSTEIGTKTPGRYIPVAQGFFLMADDDGGPIEIKRDFQEYYKEDGNESVFIRPSLTDIRIQFTDSEGLRRELLLAIRPNTTLGFDWGWDGEYFGPDTYSDMRFVIGDKDYVIQAIPEITQDLALPLHIKTTTEGMVNIEVTELTNLPQGVQMYILDESNGMTTPIDLRNEFRTYLPAGDFNNRFYLVFSPRTTKADEITEGDFRIYYADDVVYINNPDAYQIDRAYIIDMAGKVVQENDLNTNDKQIEVPVSLSTGVYLMQVITNGKKVAQKFIVE